MTTATDRPAQLTTLADLPIRERDRVLDELDALDWEGLAAAAGMSVYTLRHDVPMLWGRRGKLRTPYQLLAAVVGFGYDGPANSRGEILRRLDYGWHPVHGSHHRNYLRLAEAAEHFGITLPQVDKDGPQVGKSVRDDVAKFTAAVHAASSNSELAETLGMKPSGKTFDRNRARIRELGLPDKFSAEARERQDVDAAARRHAEAVRSAHAQGRPYRGIYPAGYFPEATWEVRQRAASTVRDRQRRAHGCQHCGGELTGKTETGKRQGWSRYCAEACRRAADEARRKERNAAQKAAQQKPCLHCGTDIVPGPRTKKFCDKSCAKKYGYRANTAKKQHAADA